MDKKEYATFRLDQLIGRKKAKKIALRAENLAYA